jgi:hypothetical protein
MICVGFEGFGLFWVFLGFVGVLLWVWFGFSFLFLVGRFCLYTSSVRRSALCFFFLDK